MSPVYLEGFYVYVRTVKKQILWNHSIKDILPFTSLLKLSYQMSRRVLEQVWSRGLSGESMNSTYNYRGYYIIKTIGTSCHERVTPTPSEVRKWGTEIQVGVLYKINFSIIVYTVFVIELLINLMTGLNENTKTVAVAFIYGSDRTTSTLLLLLVRSVTTRSTWNRSRLGGCELTRSGLLYWSQGIEYQRVETQNDIKQCVVFV